MDAAGRLEDATSPIAASMIPSATIVNNLIYEIAHFGFGYDPQQKTATKESAARRDRRSAQARGRLVGQRWRATVPSNA
jgi:hypothetical protein